MKKKLALLLALATMSMSVVACGKKEEKVEEPTPAPVEETETEETEEPAEVAEGAIAKIGLGIVGGTNSSKDADGDKAAVAQADISIAAVAFDSEGKIVKIQIDEAQTKANFAADNSDADLNPEDTYPTKKVKADEYGMRKASEIGAEIHEQYASLEEWCIGKTADEVVNMPVKERDENHIAIPDVPELASTVTVTIESYQAAIAEAWENAVDVQGEAVELGLGVTTSVAGTPADGDKLAKIQVNTTMSALAFDAEGKVVANIIDVMQLPVNVDAEGKIAERKDDILTKKELLEDYGMRKASEIGAEWFEQAASLEEWTIGKTIEEITSMPVKERDENHKNVPDVPELASTVTITVEGYMAAMEGAATNAK
ncbi:MAG: hypothetical protein GXZ08_02890 [Tissierellia bacterium]|nr:hypothetical protein [Tissierellia bacterium]